MKNILVILTLLFVSFFAEAQITSTPAIPQPLATTSSPTFVAVNATSNAVTALQLGSGTNSMTGIALAGTRGFMGYDGANTNIQGGIGKGVTISVNSATFGSGVQAAVFDSTGSLTVLGTITKPGGASPIITTNTALTTGAGVALGTLTDAPTAGNPTKWIRINDNGTARFIPAW